MNPRDAAYQALIVLSECRGDLYKALELAKAAIDPRTKDDCEFQFRCDVYDLLSGRGGFQC